MHIAIMEYFSNKLNKNSSNQSHLRVEDRIKPISGSLNARKLNSHQKAQTSKDEEIITGLPTKSDLALFFNNKNNYYQDLLQNFEVVFIEIWKIIEKVWKEHEEERKKKILEKKNVEKQKVLNRTKNFKTFT